MLKSQSYAALSKTPSRADSIHGKVTKFVSFEVLQDVFWEKKNLFGISTAKQEICHNLSSCFQVNAE